MNTEKLDRYLKDFLDDLLKEQSTPSQKSLIAQNKQAGWSEKLQRLLTQKREQAISPQSGIRDAALRAEAAQAELAPVIALDEFRSRKISNMKGAPCPKRDKSHPA